MSDPIRGPTDRRPDPASPQLIQVAAGAVSLIGQGPPAAAPEYRPRPLERSREPLHATRSAPDRAGSHSRDDRAAYASGELRANRPIEEPVTVRPQASSSYAGSASPPDRERVRRRAAPTSTSSSGPSGAGTGASYGLSARLQ